MGISMYGEHVSEVQDCLGLAVASCKGQSSNLVGVDAISRQIVSEIKQLRGHLAGIYWRIVFCVGNQPPCI